MPFEWGKDRKVLETAFNQVASETNKKFTEADVKARYDALLGLAAKPAEEPVAEAVVEEVVAEEAPAEEVPAEEAPVEAEPAPKKRAPRKKKD